MWKMVKGKAAKVNRSPMKEFQFYDKHDMIK